MQATIISCNRACWRFANFGAMIRSIQPLLFSLAILLIHGCDDPVGPAPIPPFMKEENRNKTPTYEEGIAFWQAMADYHREVSIFEFGMTDAGLPLHVVVIANEAYETLEAACGTTRNKLFINNAIHPGEPDGVDASMLLAHQLMNEDPRRILLGKTAVFIIPFYNIGGTLNRNSTSRANQNGPEEYGFRGNAQNLDLNRDFVKADSRNARSFAQLIQLIDPELYVETHVSNGADYQYVITYLSTQEDKLGGPLGNALRNDVTPFLKKQTKAKGYEMCPYVNIHGDIPDNGFSTFYDQPRYSTGYLALHSIPGYITETHMLKPYEDRVYATLAFLQSCLHQVNSGRLKTVKKEQRQWMENQVELSIDWELDSSRVDSFRFQGYEAGYKVSEVTGHPRLYYDRNKPFEKMIPYFGHMKASHSLAVPPFYILKRGYFEVEERLKDNGVEMVELLKDTTLRVISYTVDTFSTFNQTYEKHYGHFSTRVHTDTLVVRFRKGDYLIPMKNYRRRFVLEVLEPTAPDGYFSWGFFDAILQQKEWYSSYVFEDEAAEMLKRDSILRQTFQNKKLQDPEFAADPRLQLYWIYRQSPRYESSHLRYPVYRGIAP